MYSVQDIFLQQQSRVLNSFEKSKKYVNVTRNGKTFKQLREVKDKQPESRILQHLSTLVKMTSGKQKKFFEYQLHNAKIVNIDKSPSTIKHGNPQVKQCYKNSIDVVQLNEGVKYVEGFVTLFGIPIEHAWNVKDGKYFDVTEEGPLSKYKNKFEEYVSIIELDRDEVEKSMYDTGYYGPFLSNIFQQQEK